MLSILNVYGYDPPSTVTPHGSHVDRLLGMVTLLETVKLEDMSETTQSVVLPPFIGYKL